MPRPRWDLVRTRAVMALGVQASRGCPYGCEFCLVRHIFGPKQRYRDLDNLVEEIRSAGGRAIFVATNTDHITFVDDNLTSNKPYARELMRRLKPLKVSWMCQASLDVCEDEGLLKAMSAAGCTSMLLGIESLNPESLKETRKLQNRVERYAEGIRRVHRQGIHVIANQVSLIMLNILTATPGTDLFRRMEQTGRLSVIDPDLLNGMYPTLRFRNMSQTEVFERYFHTLERMFDYGEVRHAGQYRGALVHHRLGQAAFADLPGRAVCADREPGEAPAVHRSVLARVPKEGFRWKRRGVSAIDSVVQRVPPVYERSPRRDPREDPPRRSGSAGGRAVPMRDG